MNENLINVLNQYRTNKSYIYKLLKCIALLEDRIGANEPSFDLYRKIQCKYCKCKMNTSHTHDHINDNELLKYIRITCFEEDPFDTTTTTTAKNSILFDKFPSVVLEKLFNYCTHKTLFDFAKAYPNYLNDIIDPIYWRLIKIDLSDLLFNQIDILTIIMYLNKNLKRLSFKECFSLTAKRLSLYFDFTPNLTHLELGRVNDLSNDFIHVIVSKLKYLNYINFEWNCKLMRDEHLIKLLELKYLHSIDLSQCSFLNDDAVLEFVKNVKKLIHFNIDGIQYLNDETIRQICMLHSSTLEYFLLDGEESTDDAFVNIDQCTKLKLLHISYAKLLTKTTLLKISELNDLVSLTIRHTNINEPKTFENFFEHSYFPKLKILHLEKCDSIDDDALFYLPVCFPSLEELYIPWCWEIGEDGLRHVAMGCNKLKYMDLTGLNGITGNVFEMVPKFYLKEIAYINLTYCRGISTSKDVFRNILSHRPKVLVLDYYTNPMTLDSISRDCDSDSDF